MWWTFLCGSTPKRGEADSCLKGSIQVVAVTRQAGGIPGLPAGAPHFSELWYALAALSWSWLQDRCGLKISSLPRKRDRCGSKWLPHHIKGVSYTGTCALSGPVRHCFIGTWTDFRKKEKYLCSVSKACNRNTACQGKNPVLLNLLQTASSIQSQQLGADDVWDEPYQPTHSTHLCLSVLVGCAR